MCFLGCFVDAFVYVMFFVWLCFGVLVVGVLDGVFWFELRNVK